jgi:hypothetical protein
MRLYRQKQRGDWAEVFDRVAQALQNFFNLWRIKRAFADPYAAPPPYLGGFRFFPKSLQIE